MHPHVERRILDKLKSLHPTATVACTLQLTSYLHVAVLDTLRLFPPMPFEEKEAVGGDMLLDGTKVTKGTRVIFCIYAMGMMEQIRGSDCHEFRPERWLSDVGRVRHEPSHKFAVFNCGPRSCLGKNLRLSNIKVVASGGGAAHAGANPAERASGPKGASGWPGPHRRHEPRGVRR
ncbi:alkane hydroxylase MAH1-like [Setaria viridis]|uniref:alkane hydroxylase MAH1-like n=1 Tax=Setaria viridis TaxID=4556 RepID=UPI0014936B7E|nr:alkane hydroxylase MAH1-like [Setaria viridis]